MGDGDPTLAKGSPSPMNSTFRISIDSWTTEDCRDPEIQATAAEVSIDVGSHRATEVEDRLARTIRRTIRVSALPLATWFLENWWRLRWEPARSLPVGSDAWLNWNLSHLLPSVGRGYAWPPLRFSSEGDVVQIRSTGASNDDRYPDLSPIRYLNSFEAAIDASSFEQGVWHFVYAVIARLDSFGYRDTVLHQLRKELQEEVDSASLGFTRRLEAALGLDPDQNISIVSGLSSWAHIGVNALWEIAAAIEPLDLKSALDVSSALGEIDGASSQTKSMADVHELESLRSLIVDQYGSVKHTPWLFARMAAKDLREHWSFGSGAITTAELADRLSMSVKALNEFHPSAPFTVAVSTEGTATLKLVLNRRHENSHRFDVARLIGDWLTSSSNDSWRPATKAVTVRQKVQRAFAAEFLCPSDELVRRFDRPLALDAVEETVEEIAKEFHVSEVLVLSHLVNRGLAPRSLLDTGMTIDPLESTSFVSAV
jgi:hypothetical protein